MAAAARPSSNGLRAPPWAAESLIGGRGVEAEVWPAKVRQLAGVRLALAEVEEY